MPSGVSPNIQKHPIVFSIATEPFHRGKGKLERVKSLCIRTGGDNEGGRSSLGNECGKVPGEEKSGFVQNSM